MNRGDYPSRACVFSVDVEDWFHILDSPGTPVIEDWDLLPSRVERNLVRMLDLLDQHRVCSTFFFLGWVATKFPWLVKEATRRGHELASHGYAHRLIYQMTRREFLEDASGSRKLLEDISGRPVLGFRAPGFSATAATPWFFEALLEAGFRYDSSVFPAPHGHGGMTSSSCAPHFRGDLLEFPVTVTTVLGRAVCCFGGGYLRLSPLHLIRAMTLRVLNERRPVVFYIHPREIDPAQPRLRMNPKRRFKSYVNLASTEKKIISLLREFRFITFAALEKQYRQSAAYSINSHRPVRAAIA